MENILIRPAQAKDIAAILDLIVELARYEKEEDAVEVTLEEIQKDFENGIFEAIVAEEKGTVIGMALYYMTYSTWKGRMLYLEDFVLRPAYRRKGIGQSIFNAVMDVAKSWGCRLMKLQVLDWNEPAINFYKKNQAIIETEWHNGKVFF